MAQLVLDDSKPFQVIHDWNGVQIFRLNSNKPEIFVNEINKFVLDIPNHVDANGMVKIIYIIDVMPPLSSILKLSEAPRNYTIKWSASAVIKPKNTIIYERFIPVIMWGLNLRKDELNFSLNFFDNSTKDNIDIVINALQKEVDEKLKKQN